MLQGSAVFQNYTSLDENSATSLSNLFGPISDFAPLALAPTVQIFSTMHDVLKELFAGQISGTHFAFFFFLKAILLCF